MWQITCEWGISVNRVSILSRWLSVGLAFEPLCFWRDSCDCLTVLTTSADFILPLTVSLDPCLDLVIIDSSEDPLVSGDELSESLYPESGDEHRSDGLTCCCSCTPRNEDGTY